MSGQIVDSTPSGHKPGPDRSAPVPTDPVGPAPPPEPEPEPEPEPAPDLAAWRRSVRAVLRAKGGRR